MMDSDLPDGQFAHIRHAQIARRVNLSHGGGIAEHPKSTSHSEASRPHKRGASRSSRTLRRDAVDAGGAADESADLRTAKSCGPDAPTLASSWRKQFRRRRWQKSPVTGESTK
jgi:hypothetical protein